MLLFLIMFTRVISRFVFSAFCFFRWLAFFQVGDSAGKAPTPIENKFSALNMDEENDD